MATPTPAQPKQGFWSKFGHTALQVGMLALQGYVAYLQGGQVGAINVGIGLAQAALTQSAKNSPSPKQTDGSTNQ